MRCFIICLYFIAFFSFGEVLPAPVVTSVSISGLTTTSQFQIMRLSFDDAFLEQTLPKGTWTKWGFVDSNGSGSTPYKSSFFATEAAKKIKLTELVTPSTSAMTVRDYLKRLENYVGYSETMVSTYTSSKNIDLCHGLVTNTHNSRVNAYGATVAEAFTAMVAASGSVIFNTGCTEVPPTNISCDISPASIELDFGTVIASHAKEAKTNIEKLTLHCSADVIVSLSGVTGSSVALNNNGVATLYQDENLLGEKTISATEDTDTIIELYAMLDETGEIGAFTGSTVLRLQYY